MNTVKTIKIKDLKHLPFNRDIEFSHVKNLLSSIRMFGNNRVIYVIRTKAITGHYYYYIADGQHYVEALKMSGSKEVQASVVESNDISWMVNYIAVLNNAGKNWHIKNYVEAFSYLEKATDYKELDFMHNITGFTHMVCAEILGSSSLIKTGKFSVFKPDAEEMKKALLDIASTFDINNAKFHKGFIRFHRDMKGKYDKLKLYSNLKEKLNDVCIIDSQSDISIALKELCK